MTREQHLPRRIILSATCYTDAQSAMEIALHLARQLNSALLGLLVEDEAAHIYVGFPNARTVAAPGQVSTAITAKKMHSAFRRDAKLFRRALENRALNARLNWSFQQERGHLHTSTQKQATAGDFLLFGFYRPERHATSLAVVLGGTPDPGLSQLGVTLAKDTGLPLLFFVPAQTHLTQEFGPEAGTANSLFETREYASHDDLLRQIGCLAAKVVLVSAHCEEITAIEALQQKARCPIIIPAKSTPNHEDGALNPD